MASKFQNRLMGTVVLVALVVIVLPAILDGHKRHYKDNFAAIPLMPKSGDSTPLPALPPANQPLALPSQPPEGAGEEVQAANAAVPSLETVRQAANQGSGVVPSSPPPRPHSAHDEQDEIMALLQSKLTHSSTAKPAVNALRQTATTQSEPPSRPQASPPPVASAWVVQLGALKNADKVNEIVDKLRAAGYRVYTVPATPQQNSITRILVGPESNKDKLNAALDDLRRLSGLSGVVKNYRVGE